ncbi:MAG: hypothetical protein H6Q10_695 [Acidobacteria bacterium]|nr:hypothetical protein [Acidobacteriota bacterium]
MRFRTMAAVLAFALLAAGTSSAKDTPDLDGDARPARGPAPPPPHSKNDDLNEK